MSELLGAVDPFWVRFAAYVESRQHVNAALRWKIATWLREAPVGSEWIVSPSVEVGCFADAWETHQLCIRTIRMESSRQWRRYIVWVLSNKDGTWDARQSIVHSTASLLEFSDVRAALDEILSNTTDEDRLFAVEALSMVSFDAAYDWAGERLFGLARDTSDWARGLALMTLAERAEEDDEIREFLLTVARDRGDPEWALVIDAMLDAHNGELYGLEDDPELYQPLLEIGRDPKDPEWRKVMGWLGWADERDPGVRRAILSVARDRDHPDRYYALNVLWRLAHDDPEAEQLYQTLHTTESPDIWLPPRSTRK